MACKGFDGQVARHDPRVKDLIEKFVCVRMVQANAMDLSLFQFDFDLTFAAFMMNADGTIYGRFGTRSDQKEAMREMSMEAFRKALARSLEIHAAYPMNRASLRGKKGPTPRFRVPEEYPTLREKYTAKLDLEGNVARSCLHCHMVGAAERTVYRSASEPIPDDVLYPWPMPDVLGLVLDPQERARIKGVAAGSAAAKDGFRAGDDILALEGQPIISIADVQWVLHRAGSRSKLEAEVLRGGRKVALSLSLPNGWRRKGDISWRPTTWDLRRMGTGGLALEDLPAAERRRAGIGDAKLALRVRHVGQYGAHAAAKRAGFRKEDVLVALDGRDDRMSESQLLARVLQRTKPGDLVPVTVLRRGRRVELELPMQ